MNRLLTALNRKIIDLFEREGIEAWHTSATESLLPEGVVCQHCGEVRPPGQGFRKEKDILDVWFDSGVSWLAVCESDPELKDIYTDFQIDKGETSLFRGRRPASRLVRLFPAHFRCSARPRALLARLDRGMDA